MDIISILVNRIDLLCQTNEITTNKMLFDCGLSKDVINNMKKEKPSIPSVDKILKIAQYFSVSVDYLLGNEEKPNTEISVDKKTLYNKLKALCEEKGTTVTKLCEIVTGSSGNLATWKKGYMRSDYLAKAAEYLGISTDYLLDIDTKRSENDTISELSTDKKRFLELTNIERRLLDAFKVISHDDQLIELGRIERMAEENATPPMAFAARSAGSENTNCHPKIDPAKLEALDDIPTMSEE